jgi:hypothetical protein
MIVCGVSLLVALTGCDIQQLAQPPAGAQQGPTNVGAAAGVAVDGSNMAAPVRPAAGTPTPPVGPTPMPQAVPAGVGVGQRGRSLDQYEGAVVTPVKSLFSTQEFLTYNVAVTQALNLYEAEHGNRPKTHQEFMDKIIKANNIHLPELPPGRTYRWDPTQGEKGELMVDPPPIVTPPPNALAPSQP